MPSKIYINKKTKRKTKTKRKHYKIGGKDVEAKQNNAIIDLIGNSINTKKEEEGTQTILNKLIKGVTEIVRKNGTKRREQFGGARHQFTCFKDVSGGDIKKPILDLYDLPDNKIISHMIENYKSHDYGRNELAHALYRWRRNKYHEDLTTNCDLSSMQNKVAEYIIENRDTLIGIRDQKREKTTTAKNNNNEKLLSDANEKKYNDVSDKDLIDKDLIDKIIENQNDTKTDFKSIAKKKLGQLYLKVSEVIDDAINCDTIVKRFRTTRQKTLCIIKRILRNILIGLFMDTISPFIKKHVGIDFARIFKNAYERYKDEENADKEVEAIVDKENPNGAVQEQHNQLEYKEEQYQNGAEQEQNNQMEEHNETDKKSDNTNLIKKKKKSNNTTTKLDGSYWKTTNSTKSSRATQKK